MNEATSSHPSGLPSSGVLPPPPRGLRIGFGQVLSGALFVLGVSLAAGLVWFAVNSNMILDELLTTQPAELISHGWLVVFAWLSAGAFAGWPLIVSRRHGTGSVRRDFGFRFDRADLKWGVVMAVGTIGLSVLLTEMIIPAVTGSDVGTNTAYLPITEFHWTLFVPFLIAASALTGVGEELFFRGVVLRAGLARFRPGLAIAIQAIIFGFAHYGGAEGSALAATLVFAGLTGAVFGVIVVRSGRLGLCVCAHALNNAGSLLFVRFGIEGV